MFRSFEFRKFEIVSDFGPPWRDVTWNRQLVLCYFEGRDYGNQLSISGLGQGFRYSNFNWYKYQNLCHIDNLLSILLR